MTSEHSLDNIKFDFNKINVPTSQSHVHKEECCLSFHTTKSEGGLNICLNTFLAFSPRFTHLHYKVTGNNVFLNIKHIRRPKNAEESKEEEKKPTKLAIGVDGGFAYGDKDVSQEEFDQLLSLVWLGEEMNHIITLPNPNLPTKVQMAIDGILAASSQERKQDVAAWEGDVLVASPHAKNLVQIGNKKIPPHGWKCEHCDLTENLWLCLSCGELSCGRKFWDGTGGNNHGVEHYQKTGHPLVVKLGTIENAGEKADVYSYPEDAMVTDEFLVKHLEYFGIDVLNMKKTEKTMAEMELDQNLSFDFSRIQESDKILVPLFGPGFTGLRNLGNSCYMASILQTLFSIQEFQTRFADPDMNVYTENREIDHVELQSRKVANGLLSGEYAQPINDGDDPNHAYQEGIPPKSFKHTVGKNHSEFSTMRQQDALEFLQYYFELLERNQKTSAKHLPDPTHPFRFTLEDRIMCSVSGQVKYVQKLDNVLSVPVPLEAAINKEEYAEYTRKEKERKEQEEKEKKTVVDNVNSKPLSTSSAEKVAVVRPRVPMKACVDATAQPDDVPGFYSTAIKSRTTAIKTTKLASFPEYLVVQVRRFVLDGWVPKKLDVFIENPQEIDLSHLRATGPQSEEVLLPEEEASTPSDAPQLPSFDINIVNSLIEMGFPEIRAQRAAIANQNVEQAMMWIFEHENDPDIDQPLQPVAKKSSNVTAVSEELVEQIVMMGIERDAAILALKSTDNNVERAIDWVFSHTDDIAQLIAQDKQQSEKPAQEQSTENKVLPTDGSGKYELIAFVSHIGNNTNCGHYVAHIKKNVANKEQWVLFNDSKVALSEDPPFDMGYLYFYKRK